VFKPEGINLYVFNKKSLLYPRVPLFEFSPDNKEVVTAKAKDV
jgi:hypothetical protein